MVTPNSKSNFEIIIPIANISIGNTKTRLANKLSELQRKNLTIWLLNHVVTTSYMALSQLKMKPYITILGNEYSTPEFDYISHIYSIKNQIPIKNLGNNLNDSLQQYLDISKKNNKLILPADLGMIQINDILQFIQKSNNFKIPVIAKANKDNGTNGLLLPLNKDFKFRFGKNSFTSHIDILRTYEIVNSHGINNDIDEHSDLIKLMKNNNSIKYVLDIKGKIVIPFNEYSHVNKEINVNLVNDNFTLPNNMELKESKKTYFYNKSIDIIIN